MRVQKITRTWPLPLIFTISDLFDFFKCSRIRYWPKICMRVQFSPFFDINLKTDLRGKNFLYFSTRLLNSHPCGLSLWRPRPVKSISCETVWLNRLFIFFQFYFSNFIQKIIPCLEKNLFLETDLSIKIFFKFLNIISSSLSSRSTTDRIFLGKFRKTVYRAYSRSFLVENSEKGQNMANKNTGTTRPRRWYPTTPVWKLKNWKILIYEIPIFTVLTSYLLCELVQKMFWRRKGSNKICDEIWFRFCLRNFFPIFLIDF